MENFHLPVMPDEVIGYFKPLLANDAVFVDCTLGGGGHSEALLLAAKKLGKKIRVIGIDQDRLALQNAQIRLTPFKHQMEYVSGNFSQIGSLVKVKVAGILLDLGVSSHQIDTPERGFSHQFDGPLDMRMNPSEKRTAADIVNNSSEKELEHIFRSYGEERFSALIARSIVMNRPFNTSAPLKLIIEKSTPGWRKRETVTRIFQALRIAVNDELHSLEKALQQSVDLLQSDGRIVVISYHSLEDRIVKSFFRQESLDCVCPPLQLKCNCGHIAKLKILTKKPLVPTEQEMESNSRSRSAKMRAAERT